MNDKPILIKIKDWMEVRMQSSPFINFAVGVSIMVLAVGAATWLGSSVLLALMRC